ncbi:hypothetical protein ElyMa_001866700 [Elysia marginata]|uniref:Uncharacterized protein n=1 Tax=Elysia marginata TaxID=1093978 RepID=A0AAV4EPX1_9GAST|nr:hypothetical protein ElyMa_001866700 [Elysia marginata]
MIYEFQVTATPQTKYERVKCLRFTSDSEWNNRAWDERWGLRSVGAGKMATGASQTSKRQTFPEHTSLCVNLLNKTSRSGVERVFILTAEWDTAGGGMATESRMRV